MKRCNVVRILFAVIAASLRFVIYAPIHYAWRWRQNDRQYEQDLINKDTWVMRQVFIPIEGWALGIVGAGGVAYAFRRLKQPRPNNSGDE